MHRPHVTRRLFEPPAGQLCWLVAWVAVACSSYVENTSSTPDPVTNPTPSAPPVVNAGSGGTAGNGTPSLVPVAPQVPEGQGSAPLLPPSSGGSPASMESDTVSDVCQALGSDDACAACVCGACSGELADCASTAGCPEILACVRESGCTGTDCYCGDARPTECLRGDGNGPCKELVLAAPGGKEPSLLSPSGGPATDAALRVADCANEDAACGNVCDVGG
jgi:hypothetical protein